MVRSTTICPSPDTSSAVAAASGCTAKPVVHTVNWAGISPAAPVTTPVRLDARDVGPLVDRDAEPVEGGAQVTLGLLAQPVADASAGGDRDLELRAGLGDLGGRLDAGQAAADDQHRSARRQFVRRARSRSAACLPATLWAYSATPGTPWSAPTLPRA